MFYKIGNINGKSFYDICFKWLMTGKYEGAKIRIFPLLGERVNCPHVIKRAILLFLNLVLNYYIFDYFTIHNVECRILFYVINTLLFLAIESFIHIRDSILLVTICILIFKYLNFKKKNKSPDFVNFIKQKDFLTFVLPMIVIIITFSL